MYWCIDPVGGNDKTGMRQLSQHKAEDTPFKTWAAVVWNAGDIFLQKAGTTANENVIINKIGAQANSIKMGTYGQKVRAIVEGDKTVFTANGQHHIDVENFRFTGDKTPTPTYNPAVNTPNSSHISFT